MSRCLYHIAIFFFLHAVFGLKDKFCQVVWQTKNATCFVAELPFANAVTRGLLRQNTGMQYDIDLDARTLHCPLPILKAKKALSNMQSGQILKITTTDAGAERDFQVFALQTGNTLLRQEKHDGMMFHWLQRR